MKKLMVVSALLIAASSLSAWAGNDMAGMDMSPGAPAMNASSDAALTDAEVRKIDPATGMVTLKHGAPENTGSTRSARSRCACC
jgi:Cu/Ag efflux protein CusF